MHQISDPRLKAAVEAIPFLRFLGVSVMQMGDELSTLMRFTPSHIGAPFPPALHGGATAGFLESTALINLVWQALRKDANSAPLGPKAAEALPLLLPKTIDFTVDYMRAGRPQDSFARAYVARSGRRYASVHVEAWQEDRRRPFAQAVGHFLMPASASAETLTEGEM